MGEGAIYLIRHGAINKKEGKEPELSEEGKKQVKLLAKRLSKIPVNKCYVSPSLRSMQTFEPYKKLNPKVETEITDDALEMYRVILGGNKIEGIPVSRIDRDLNRAKRLWGKILNDVHNNKIILVFTHSNLIKYFLTKVWNVNPKGMWLRINIETASVTCISLNKGRDILQTRQISDVSHYSSDVNDLGIKSNESIEK